MEELTKKDDSAFVVSCAGVVRNGKSDADDDVETCEEVLLVCGKCPEEERVPTSDGIKGEGTVSWSDGGGAR